MAERDPRAELLSRVAAVDAFHPTAVPGFSAADCMRLVGRDIDVVSTDGQHTAWSLRLDVRRGVLAEQPSAASALAAAESIPARVKTAAQEVFEGWLREGAPPSGDVDRLAFERVVEWLASATWAPGVAAARARVAEGRKRDRLLVIAGDHFVGRDRERSLLKRVVTGADEHRFVVVDGGGGMGKSSLLARLVLDIEGWRTDGPIAVAHVDFDDPRVDLRSEASLLGAVFGELSGRLGAEIAGLVRELAEVQADADRAEGSSGALAESERVALDARVHMLADEAGRRVGAAIAAKRFDRLVVLVDTFERAVRRSPELAGRSLALLWHVLSDLPAALVVCGRGVEYATKQLSPNQRPPLVVALGELDRESSVALLRAQGLAEHVAAKLSVDLPDRPLTLRLAARALRERGASAEALDAPELGAAIQRALVDGYLHLRVLAHLGEPRLQAMLHPGFVLRRLTPEAILEVLGDRATPPVATLDEAEGLWIQLSRAQDLVVELPSERRVLSLRPEVRREILTLVQEDRPDDVRALHERAATWYGARSSVVDRAEGVYHLLALERLAEAKKRWAPELAPLLLDAPDELPIPAREWLRIHLAIESGNLEGDRDPGTPSPTGPRAPRLPHAVGRERSPEWDVGAAKELEELLAARRLDAAGWLLAYWTERDPRSPLHPLAARYHRLVGQTDDAEREALLALAARPPAPKRAELRVVLAWAAAERLDPDEVDRRAKEALADVEGLEPWDRLRRLVELAEALALRFESPIRRLFWSIEDRIQVAFDETPEGLLRADRALSRGAAAHLHDRKRLARCLELGAANELRDPWLQGLAMALDALDPQPAELAKDADVLARDGKDTVPDRTPTWSDRLRLLARRPERFVKWLHRMLEVAGGEEAILEALRELLARDARAPAALPESQRTDALTRLSRFVDERFDAAARAELAEALGGAAVLGAFEPSGPGLVSAADRSGQLGALIDWAEDRAPDETEALALLADELVRPPPFRHFPVNRILDLWRTLVASPLIQKEGLTPLWQGMEGGLVGTPPLSGKQNRPARAAWLQRALARMNETPKLLGGAPLETFLAHAAELELGPDADRVVAGALDELWQRRGLGAPERDETPAPLPRSIRTEPVTFLRDGAAAEKSVAAIWVPRIEGGRRVGEGPGKAGVRGNAWRIAPDLVLTALFVVRARYPGDPAPDDEDLKEQVQAAAMDGGLVARGVVASSDALGYAVLEVSGPAAEPLRIRQESFPGGKVSVLMHASNGEKTLVLSEARLAQSSGRLEYVADGSHGWLGAPLFDDAWRVVGMDWGARLREGVFLRFGLPIREILSDLRRRFPEIAARLVPGGS